MSKKHNNGQILKIKEGFNPNSSSIGSIVFSLPVILLWTVPLFGLGAASFFTWISTRKGALDLIDPPVQKKGNPSHQVLKDAEKKGLNEI